MPDIRILTEGDSSVLVEFGKEISPEINRKITATVQLMKEQHIEGVVDMIPAFCSLLVNYDPNLPRRCGTRSAGWTGTRTHWALIWSSCPAGN